MKRTRITSTLLTTLVASLLIPAAALAGSIHFAFRGTPSTSGASWDGGSSSMNASADQVAVGLSSNAPSPLVNAQISFTSGPGESGLGTSSSPYLFGASLADSIIITGCLPGAGANCSPVTLFAGQFQGGEMAFWSDGKAHFDAFDVTGTINPLLASYLGLSSDNFTGQLQAMIACSMTKADTCTPGTERILAGGQLVLTPGGGGTPPVPEPSALFLLGSGVAGLALLMKRRIRSTE